MNQPQLVFPWNVTNSDFVSAEAEAARLIEVMFDLAVTILLMATSNSRCDKAIPMGWFDASVFVFQVFKPFGMLEKKRTN